MLPGHQLKQLLRPVRQLQTILGDHQDCEVQAHELLRFKKARPQEKPFVDRTHMALGVLIDNLNAQKIRERQKFRRHFDKFSGKRIEKEFRAICKKRALNLRGSAS